MNAPSAQLEAYQVREIAVAAQADPRTVQRLLTGKRVQPIIRARIVAALEAKGFGHLLAPRETP